MNFTEKMNFSTTNPAVNRAIILTSKNGMDYYQQNLKLYCDDNDINTSNEDFDGAVNAMMDFSLDIPCYYYFWID